MYDFTFDFNERLGLIPERSQKPRKDGLTMVMDKGLSLSEAESCLENGSAHTDLVKLGWSTGLFNRKLRQKIDRYRQENIRCYLGGTLFELFVARKRTEEFKKLLDELDLDTVEISDGSLDMAHDTKCEYIRDFARNFKVLSEVGSKDAEKIIAPYR
ncbi:MAG: phosphosulfolactate synthase, partial [Bacteroidota bacterium]